MAGYLYDGGGSDESGLTVVVRLSGNYNSVRLLNKDEVTVWSSDVDAVDPYIARVTGLSTFDLPLILQSYEEPVLRPGGGGTSPGWLAVAELTLPTVPWNMYILGLPAIGVRPAPPRPRVTTAYLQAVPGRTSPIDGDVLAEVARINQLAEAALAVLAALVKAKALRDLALGTAQAYGAAEQSAATLIGSSVQALATNGAALSSTSGVVGASNPTWGDLISGLVSGVTALVGAGDEIAAFASLERSLSTADGNSQEYVRRVGSSNFALTGEVTNGVLEPGPDYWEMRQNWLEATEQLFSYGNYLNPAWFKLRDVPVWIG